MRSQILVRFVAFVVVSVFAAGLWASGEEFDVAWLRWFSLSVWVALSLLLLWDRFFWRWTWLQRLPGVPRDIGGTWCGTLTSFWTDPETGRSPEPKTVFLVVRQRATFVSAVLLTDESRSKSTVAVVSDDGTVASFDYMYLNRPDSRVEHRSRMHHGSTSLDIIGRPATRLRGRYWTDRDTKGELEFRDRVSKLVDGYAEATSLFEE
jgi:hypothetical protein